MTKYNIGVLIRVILSGVLSTAAISCTEDMVSLFERPIQLTANTGTAGTRAGQNIQSTNFDLDEPIRIYILGKNGTKVCDGAVFTAGEVSSSTGRNILIPPNNEPVYFPLEDEHVDIYAYYPQFVLRNVENDEQTFTVRSTQGEEQDYKDSDLMFATPIMDQRRTSGTLNLDFTHKMVKFIFNVEGDFDEDKGDTFTFGSPYLTGVKRSIGFNTETGGLTDLDEDNCDRGDVMLDNGGAIIIPPQEIQGNFIAVKDIVSVRDGEAREGTAIFSLTNAKQLVSGKVYTVNITIGHDNISTNDDGTPFVYTITKWDEDAGIITIAPAGTTGLVVTQPEDMLFNGEELCPEPEVRYGLNRVLEKDKDYTLQYFNNVHGGKATILIIGIGEYEGSSAATSFTIKPAEGILSYPSDVIEEGIVSPGRVDQKYTYRGNVDNPLSHIGTGTITFESVKEDGTDGSAIASVDPNTGVVTIMGAGTTIIKAHMAANSDYTEADAQYTLVVGQRTVGDAGEDLQIKLTGIPDVGYYTYDNTEHQPTVTVLDGEVTLPNTYYDITWPESLIDANEANTITVTFKATSPYEGDKSVTYRVAKAKTNLQVGSSTLYIAKPKTAGTTEASRSRTISADWGLNTAIYTPEGGNSGIATISRNGSVFTFVGNKDLAENETNHFTMTVTIPENTNWEKETKDIEIYVVESLFNYGFEGKTRKWTCPAKGVYLLEVAGAQGGSVPSNNDNNGLGGGGGYVAGRITIGQDVPLYVNVGGAGKVAAAGAKRDAQPDRTSQVVSISGTNTTIYKTNRAWNGGGYIVWGMHNGAVEAVDANGACCGGGGATDIALDGTENSTDWQAAKHLYTRIIVGGGGGGAIRYVREGNGLANGGAGGSGSGDSTKEPTWNGCDGGASDYGKGGTLTAGGLAGIINTDRNQYKQYTAWDNRGSGWSGADGVFGEGGWYYDPAEGGGAGGGGWYGGGSCGQSGINGSGGGGSSYLWCNKTNSTTYPTTTGVQNPSQRNFPKLEYVNEHGGENSNDAGNANGYARITCISIIDEDN